MNRVVWAVLLACISAQAQVESGSAVRKPRVELKLTKGENYLRDHRNIVIRLWNDSDVALNLPKPTEICSFGGGYIATSTKILRSGRKPLRPVTVCAADFWIPGDLSVQAKDWITIKPGSSYEVTAPLATAVDLVPGEKVEARAYYEPPQLTEQQVQILEEHGFHPPRGKAESQAVVVQFQGR